MKQYIVLFTAGILLMFLLIEPKAAFDASSAGLILWYKTLLPALLPCMILSDLLLSFQHIQSPCVSLKKEKHIRKETLYPLFMGMLCGFPIGAKITSEMYCYRKISKNEAQFLLLISNNPSPMFISTYIANATLKQSMTIPYLFVVIYAGIGVAGFACYIYLKLNKKACPEIQNDKKETSSPLPTGKRMDASIMNGFESAIRLGGYIILFSILAGLFKKLFNRSPIPCALLLGVIEISTGIHEMTCLPICPVLKSSLILGSASFGGLSVAAQTASIIRASGLSMKTYLIGKVLCGICTFLISLLFFVVFL